MSKYISVEQEQEILVVRIQRPEKKNALNFEMYAALAETLDTYMKTSTLGALVILGQKGVFSAGNDIADFMSHAPTKADSPVVDFLRAISQCEKPIVAGVSGIAVGIGTTLLLHCDLVYADQEAQFQLPFINLGLVPEAGSSLILPLIAGHQKAAELLMLGELFDVETAQSVGFINKVLPHKNLESYAIEQAHQLSQKPRNALRMTKKLLKSAQPHMQDRMLEELELFTQCLKSDEAQQAFMAFIARSKN